MSISKGKRYQIRFPSQLSHTKIRLTEIILPIWSLYVLWSLSLDNIS